MDIRAMALVLVLAGCGRMNAWNTDALDDTEPIDTAVDGDADTDADADTDVDTDADTDADSDTDPVSQAPTLVLLDARESGDRVEVAFRTSDPDGDLDGGFFELVIDGATNKLRIPQDIDSWAPSGESKVYVDFSSCSGGASHTFQGRVIDKAGNASGTKSDSLTLSGSADLVPENPNDGSSPYYAGALSIPAYFCGRIDAASNDGEVYTGDVEYIEFDATTSGYFKMQLTWDAAGSDYDLHLYDYWGFTEAHAIQDGGAQPEVIDEFLFAGETYLLIVGAWAGSPGDYKISIQ